MRYWAKLNPGGSIDTVESHSYDHLVPGAIELTKEEYDAFIASLPELEYEPPKPVRDLAAEIDELKVKVGELEKKVEGVS